jgi:hypothetical protein
VLHIKDANNTKRDLQTKIHHLVGSEQSAGSTTSTQAPQESFYLGVKQMQSCLPTKFATKITQIGTNPSKEAELH